MMLNTRPIGLVFKQHPRDPANVNAWKNMCDPNIQSGIPSVSNSLDPDQARPYVWPDLGPNCLQRLSADDTSRQRDRLVCTYKKMDFSVQSKQS